MKLNWLVRGVICIALLLSGNWGWAILFAVCTRDAV